MASACSTRMTARSETLILSITSCDNAIRNLGRREETYQRARGVRNCVAGSRDQRSSVKSPACSRVWSHVGCCCDDGENCFRRLLRSLETNPCLCLLVARLLDKRAGRTVRVKRTLRKWNLDVEHR